MVPRCSWHPHRRATALSWRGMCLGSTRTKVSRWHHRQGALVAWHGGPQVPCDLESLTEPEAALEKRLAPHRAVAFRRGFASIQGRAGGGHSTRSAGDVVNRHLHVSIGQQQEQITRKVNRVSDCVPASCLALWGACARKFRVCAESADEGRGVPGSCLAKSEVHQGFQKFGACALHRTSIVGTLGTQEKIGKQLLLI